MEKFNKPNSEFFICDNSNVNKYCVIVEPRSLDLTILTIKNFLYLLQEKKWGLIIFHGTDNETFIKDKLVGIKNINYFNINKRNLGESEYNDLLCSPDFWKKIKSCGAKHALIFQTDTLLLKNDLDEFLKYDYVGAPWCIKWMGMLEVGNGGLSLRNVDTMLEISKYCPRLQYQKNEDVYFCYWCIMREFKIAPADVAKKFAVESVYYDSPCGLHKPHIDKFGNRELYTKLFKKYIKTQEVVKDAEVIEDAEDVEDVEDVEVIELVEDAEYAEDVKVIELVEDAEDVEIVEDLKKDTTSFIRLRFFSNFGDSKACKAAYESMFCTCEMANYGPNKLVYITNDDDYTHAIILNTAMPLLKADIPKENVVGLAFEPIYFLGLNSAFVDYAQKYIGKYFIGDKFNLPSPFLEGFTYMWHISPLKVVPNKTKLMSIMISEKGVAPGHKYRYKLVNAILQSNLPIDIYGRGCANFNKDDNRLKGEFKEKEPYEDYFFHIAIENYQCAHYFSEKIINPLHCSSMPIYLGCKNITQYFSDNIICLTGDLNNDMQLLTSILNAPMKYYKKINAKDLDNSTNFFRNLNKLFDIEIDLTSL
jgi:hypothetical protein